jgi:hypothetical protein
LVVDFRQGRKPSLRILKGDDSACADLYGHPRACSAACEKLAMIICCPEFPR